ncbi:hypothetical protein BDP55DRAFT_343498 [Colletotrichum godetiae]|uniref:Secreted protein n=1 Tax=Colletotrichum godetiae TaxID=1209918 RepID=A0AAJ0AWG2_9PEZI|nr:uncharacterized protein BDP55DRAFT_343498 [Colletotrichum godetiae]KAK1690256.1 hypothetical protein BDP55DRAFT_343498 [Colletotrichum godetiae]
MQLLLSSSPPHLIFLFLCRRLLNFLFFIHHLPPVLALSCRCPPHLASPCLVSGRSPSRQYTTHSPAVVWGTPRALNVKKGGLHPARASYLVLFCGALPWPGPGSRGVRSTVCGYIILLCLLLRTEDRRNTSPSLNFSFPIELSSQS